MAGCPSYSCSLSNTLPRLQGAEPRPNPELSAGSRGQGSMEAQGPARLCTMPVVSREGKHIMEEETHGATTITTSQEGLAKQQKYITSRIYSLPCKVAVQPAPARANCRHAYLAPGRQLPLGFGGRPEVPRALQSATLLNRNSFLNHPTARVGRRNTFPGARPSHSLAAPGPVHKQVHLCVILGRLSFFHGMHLC